MQGSGLYARLTELARGAGSWDEALDVIPLNLGGTANDRKRRRLAGAGDALDIGKAYTEEEKQRMLGELDAFVREEVAQYLKASGIKLEGKNRGKQMRFLGVPSLSALLEHTPKPVSKPSDSTAYHS